MWRARTKRRAMPRNGRKNVMLPPRAVSGAEAGAITNI
jgi:hypothetical protein